MKEKLLSVMVALALLLTGVSTALASSHDVAVAQALDWLADQQNADGGFSDGFSPASGIAPTAEIIIAFAAGGRDVGALRSSTGASPLDFMYQQVQSGNVEGIGTMAKVVMALLAAGLDPMAFAGENLVAQLEAAFEGDSGAYGGSLFDQALVVLALVNAGREIPAAATDYLMSYQTTDGAWSFTGDTAALSGDTNTTAIVIQALAAAGGKDDTGRGLAYLQRLQNEDGGWPYQNPSPYGTETDANSTALSLQAIYAVGQTPEDWYLDGVDPLGALLSLQNANGSFSYQASFPGDNTLATIQAVPAAAGVTLAQIRRVATSATPGAVDTPPSTLPVAGGGISPLTGVMIVGGLALTVLGSWIKRLRKATG